ERAAHQHAMRRPGVAETHRRAAAVLEPEHELHGFARARLGNGLARLVAGFEGEIHGSALPGGGRATAQQQQQRDPAPAHGPVSLPMTSAYNARHELYR